MENSLDQKSQWISEIHAASTVEQATSLLKRLTTIKSVLEAAEKFHEYSVRYAVLEAEAIVRVVELGGIETFGSHSSTKYKCAKWIAGISNEDRANYIAMCADGLVLEQVYKREIGNIERRDSRIDIASKSVSSLVETFDTYGFVDIRETSQNIGRVLGGYDRLASDVMHGARETLRQHGGVGTETGIYLKPGVGSNSYTRLAYLVRFRGILRDIEKLQRIAETISLQMDLAELQNYQRSITDLRNATKRTSDYTYFYGEGKDKSEIEQGQTNPKIVLRLAALLMELGSVRKDERISSLINEADQNARTLEM